jgi:phosphoglycolate phosphatase-like HAD superfamily hydrolase
MLGTFHAMKPSQIKNIFWDVDGVLADLNYAYFHFLTGHPKCRDRYAGLKWEQLPEVLPIVPEYGALELKTHPELGAEMDRDFCADQSFFRNRPLYPKVIKVLKRLNDHGYRQFTMSATFDVEAKTAYLNEILAPVTDFLTIECVRHGEFLHDTAKIDRLRACYEKYALNPDETIHLCRIGFLHTSPASPIPSRLPHLPQHRSFSDCRGEIQNPVALEIAWREYGVFSLNEPHRDL